MNLMREEMSMSSVIYKVENHIARIILNRPEARNALTRELILNLKDCLDKAASDDDVHVVLLSAAGEKAFSAGFDLKESIVTPVIGVEARRKDTMFELSTWQKIWNMEKPVIASVQGYCIGGGVHLALMCDMIIASEDSKFGELEIAFSYVPDILIEPYKMPSNIARQLMMTGEFMDAEVLYRCGTINKLVPFERLEEESLELARKLAEVPRVAMGMLKRQINKAYEFMGMKQSMDYAAELFNLCRIDQMSSASEFNEIVKTQGLKAALEWQKQKKGNV